MGFLDDGETLEWVEAKKLADYIRKVGIEQFLRIYESKKERNNDELKWGDEIEYIIVEVDDEEKRVRLALVGHESLEKLEEMEKKYPGHSTWNPEYGAYMIEGTPGQPFGEDWECFKYIEQNMNERRKWLNSTLGTNQYSLTIPNFPLMGVNDFTSPYSRTNGPIADSLYIPDIIINPHKRFATLTKNIRERKGSHVYINVPLYQDKYTKPLTYENERRMGRKALDNHIYMDAMAFGMGMNCLQCTFQVCNIDEARNLYDQLAVLAPIMLCLTAGTPIHRGYLADIDARWKIIAGSVDDRTPEEMGEVPLKNDKFVINKSRYDSIDVYIGTDDEYKEEYNDLDLVYDPDIYETLTSRGVDDLLAKHISHLFIRDPLVIYKDKIEVDENQTNHFENIQSTNWQTVRFKPPPHQSEIGWRVEFRPMEIQLTDFENAAFTAFIVIITRIYFSLGLNLYIPISKVDENMERAHLRDAINTQTFYWRKQVYRSTAKKSCCSKPSLTPNKYSFENLSTLSESSGSVDEEYAEMTINEIFNGHEGYNYKGLCVLASEYVSNLTLDDETKELLLKYISFISKRASGELVSLATWQREFVLQHPLYKNDSVVSEEIAYDLMKKCIDISNNRVVEPRLVGDFIKL